MKKQIFLLLFAFISILSKAQLERHPGQVMIEVKFLEIGKADLYFPEPLIPGQPFSFSIKEIPNGTKEKEIIKNKEKLSQCSVEMLGQKFVIDTKSFFVDSWQPGFTIQPYNGSTKLAVIDPAIKFQSLPLISKPIINDHFLIGATLNIPGPFDGNFSNTQVFIDNKPCEILAESPRSTIIATPAGLKGQHPIKIIENGQEIGQNNAYAVDYTVNAGKLNLKKGESTFITINITGLNELKDNATLSVDNLSPEVVILEGGNAQVIPILPGSITGSGEFTKTWSVSSINTGNFSVNLDLRLPQPQGSSVNIPSSWIACQYFGGAIIPSSLCESLKKTVKPELDKIVHHVDTPTHIPITTTEINFNGDVVTTIISNKTDWPVSGIASSIQQLPKKTSMLLSIDSGNKIVPVVFSTSLLPTGIYKARTTEFSGYNNAYDHINEILVSTTSNGGITNRSIDSIKRKISAYEDWIHRLISQINDYYAKFTKNNENQRTKEAERNTQLYHYEKLQTIDAGLDKIRAEINPSFISLVDSLEKFRNRVGQLPTEDDLNKLVADLQAALDACRKETERLKQEQKDLEQKLKDIAQQQDQKLSEIVELFRSAGYNGASFSGRKGGQFSFKYGYVYQSGGNAEFVDAIPAQILGKVKTLEKEIKKLQDDYNDAKARLKDIPGDLAKNQKQCDDLSKELENARALKSKGIKNIYKDQLLNIDLDELCRQMKAGLQDLVDWSKQYKTSCTTGFEKLVEQLGAKCPKTKAELDAYWNLFASIINSKKDCEETFKKRANDLIGEIARIQMDDNRMNDSLNKWHNQLNALAEAYQKARRAEEDSIEKEMARRYKTDMELKLARQKDCAEWLNAQIKTEDEKLFIQTIVQIKEAIQEMGGKVKEYTDKGNKWTKKEYDDFAEELKKSIDKFVGPLDKYDKYKKEVDKWLKLKEDIQKLIKSPKNEQERAEQFGLALKKIHEQLGGLVKEFPILKLFVEYFGWLIDSYNWALKKSYEIERKKFNRQLEGMLSSQNCPELIKEYMKHKNIDDVFRKAAARIKWDDLIDPQLGTSESRRVAEEEFKKMVLAKLTDCCLYELMH